MKTPRLLAALLLASLVPVAGCGHPGARATPARPEAPETSGVADGGPATAESEEDSRLQVFDRGITPRYTLRYQAPAGTRQSMHMEIAFTMDSPTTGKMEIPTMVLDADVEVVSVDADGTMHDRMTFTNLDAIDRKGSPTGAADRMKANFAKLKGGAITMAVTPQGKVLGIDVDPASAPQFAQVMEQTQQTFSQMVSQLPREAVGEGARWQIQQTIDTQGLKLDQTADYTVESITATTAHVEVHTTMTAGSQPIGHGATAVTLNHLDGTADMDTTIDVTKAIPTAASGTIDMKMSMDASGKDVEMSMATRMSIEAH